MNLAKQETKTSVTHFLEAKTQENFQAFKEPKSALKK